MIVYQITNLITKKSYIGITQKTKEERFLEHKRASRIKDYPLYRSMRKYGEENFVIEEVDSAETRDELRLLEKKWIKEKKTLVPDGYNLSPGGEDNAGQDNPRSKLTEKDVVEIRKLYSNGDKPISVVYKDYENRISFSAFEKIWQGSTWKNVSIGIYTPENKKRQESFKTHFGSSNGNSLFSEDEILEARLYYVDHTLKDTWEKFGNGSSLNGFRGALTRGYISIPIYKKTKKIWLLKEEIIDINNFLNPVQTILESEE